MFQRLSVIDKANKNKVVENLKQNNNENFKVDSSLITNIRDPTG